VRRSKTEAGERSIPLNGEARRVVVELYKRAQALGAYGPDNYVFPACEKGGTLT
jgi:hypothetical protein